MRIEPAIRKSGSGPGHLGVRLAAALLALAVCAASAQSLIKMRATRISKPEFYGPPNETQMKWLLEAGEAEPESDGRGWVNVKALKVQTFSEKGQPEAVVQSPQCFLDGRERTAFSTGSLQVASVDGVFFLEGTGFLWQQTNFNLVISNNVRTLIHASITRSFER